jgi:hypothetical protein
LVQEDVVTASPIATGEFQLDRLLYGDNQFFGVNHMSEDKARAQAMRFRDNESIIEMLDVALDAGIPTFMCTTHDRIAAVADHMRADADRYRSSVLFPCMPYAHKYANAVTEDGILGALRRFLPDQGLVNTALRGGRALAAKDVEHLVQMLVDAEMSMFSGLRTPVIFLQNVVVDLLLGLGFDDAFGMFAQHVTSRFGAEPAFITMNLPRLLDVLDAQGVANPIVCSNFNKVGFRMCGGLPAYEDALRDREFRAVAMSVFASGAIEPREALEWVASYPAIRSMVFGASTESHIRQTKALVDELWPRE